MEKVDDFDLGYGERLFKTDAEFRNYIDSITPQAKYIKYKFDIDFKESISNRVDESVVNHLRRTVDESIIEMRLFHLLFTNQISITMESADFMNNDYRLKFVTLYATLTPDILSELKTFGNFYQIEGHYMNSEYLETLRSIVGPQVENYQEAVVNNSNYGHVQIEIYTEDMKKIIYVDCHSGNFDTHPSPNFL